MHNILLNAIKYSDRMINHNVEVNNNQLTILVKDR